MLLSIAAPCSVKLKIKLNFLFTYHYSFSYKIFPSPLPNHSLFNLSSLLDSLLYFFSSLTLRFSLFYHSLGYVVGYGGSSCGCGSRCFNRMWFSVLHSGWSHGGMDFGMNFVVGLILEWVHGTWGFIYLFIFGGGGWQWPVEGCWVLVCGRVCFFFFFGVVAGNGLWVFVLCFFKLVVVIGGSGCGRQRRERDEEEDRE